MTTDERFHPRERLRLRSEFRRVYEARCKRGDGRLIVYIARNELGRVRLGLSVSRRAGDAVRRNRLRRKIREAFRRSKADWPAGLDIVCVVAAAPADGYDVSGAFRRFVGQAAERLRRLHKD